MLQNIIRRGSSLICPWSSRSFQSSTSYREKINNRDYDKSSRDAEVDEKSQEYWETQIEMEDPYKRTARVLGKQMRDIRNRVLFWKEPLKSDWQEWRQDSVGFPSHIDVLIIGSGPMGVSIAYWLKKLGGPSFSVVVVDKVPLNQLHHKPMLLWKSNLRQQFALEENIEMTQFAAEFFQNINSYLGINGRPPVNIDYRPHGNLILATSNDEAEKLVKNARRLAVAGTRVSLYTPEQINKRFPWINTDSVLLGSLGLENEGSVNPWAVMDSFAQKAIDLDVEFITAEVKGFVLKKSPNLMISSPAAADLFSCLNHAVVKTESNEKKIIQFALCVVAAGADSSNITRLMKIGKMSGMRSVPLPIEKRKRFLYAFEALNGPGLNTPMVIDSNGCYVRRESLANHYLASRTFHDDDEETFSEEPCGDDSYFHEKIYPALVHRYPCFKDIKLTSSWWEFCDYNIFDENGIVGMHPFYNNVYFATGFGEHSLIMAPAVGRSICEHIRHNAYSTIDLTRLSFDRFMTRESMRAEIL